MLAVACALLFLTGALPVSSVVTEPGSLEGFSSSNDWLSPLGADDLVAECLEDTDLEVSADESIIPLPFSGAQVAVSSHFFPGTRPAALSGTVLDLAASRAPPVN